MYGKLNQRKIRENDYILSCQQARDELSEYMDEEAKRVNVDSAKKRAVVQHMDYEGFRQMVLGANIFPTKSKQLYSFSKGETNNIPTIIAEGASNQKKQKQSKPREQQIILQRIQGKSQLHCNSFRQFKKKFNQSYTAELASLEQTQSCYNLVKEQNEQRIRKIFNNQCQGNILVKICKVFQKVLLEMQQKNKEGVEAEAYFILVFLKVLTSINTMKSITLAILSKKERQTIIQTADQLKQILVDQGYKSDLQLVHNYFQK